MLKSYFDELINTLSSYKWVKSVDIIRYDIDSTDEKNILLYRLRVFLTDNSLLEMMERIVSFRSGKFYTTKYSFHWQNADGQILKRWDNAPHFPKISSYPDHIHIGSEDNVMPSFKITASDILAMIDEEFIEIIK